MQLSLMCQNKTPAKNSVHVGKAVCTIFCDICKAFDRVWHKGLIYIALVESC